MYVILVALIVLAIIGMPNGFFAHPYGWGPSSVLLVILVLLVLLMLLGRI